MIDVLIPCRQDGDEHIQVLLDSLNRQVGVDLNVIVQISQGEPLYQTRNMLLDQATSELVYYIDADDMVTKSSSLERLQTAFYEKAVVDYVWGNMEVYLTPLDKFIPIDQSNLTTRLACGTWIARRLSFKKDPWEPDPGEPHRSNWTMPLNWKGEHVSVTVLSYRKAWSSKQLTADMIVND